MCQGTVAASEKCAMQSKAVSAIQAGTTTHVVPELVPVRLYLHLVLYRIQIRMATAYLVRTCVPSPVAKYRYRYRYQVRIQV